MRESVFSQLAGWARGKPFIKLRPLRRATHPLGGFPARALIQDGFLETRSWENKDSTPATGRGGKMLPDDCSAKLDLRCFDGAGDAEGRAFAEMAGENLHAHGKAGFGCAARYGDAADAGEAGGDGVDVGKVHGQRIVALLADFEGRGRRGGRYDGVDFGKGAQEFLGEDAADLLRLEVVGVVVAGGERVGAEEDAALDLGAEALVARVTSTCRRAWPSAVSGGRSARRRSGRGWRWLRQWRRDSRWGRRISYAAARPV